MAKDKIRLDDFLPAAVVFRDYLSYINKFYEKACSILNLLRMLKHILDRKIYPKPILEYGCIVWDNCSQKNSVLLENVQVGAGRIITGLRKCPVLRVRMGTPSIRRERQKLLTFYCTWYSSTLYRPKHSYNLRNADNLNFVIPQTRTVSYYNSFFTISYLVMEWTIIGNCT